MSEQSDAEEAGAVVTLESLPAGSLSMSQIETLDESDAIEVVAPLVIDTTTSRVTHFDLVVDDTHYYLGWNPTEEQWEQLLVVVDVGDDDDDKLELTSAITVYDDESGDAEIEFDPHGNPDVEDIIEFVWDYVEYSFPDTEDLYNVMDEAMEEMRSEDE